jgi:murein DD-endopeptidase MepM/ murein hydrolase activator NlpD
MTAPLKASVVSLLALVLVVATPTAGALARDANTAALQVALRGAGQYSGTVDGVRGPGTRAATAAFQRSHGLPADGVAGARTRRALGAGGRPRYGSRPLGVGAHGWDVAALQFKLAIHGFPSGPMDGGLGGHTGRAIARFQRFAGLPADGVAGRGTMRALRRHVPRSPVRLLRPVQAAFGDRFGPRTNRFHAGLDFPAASGTPVTAAGRGTVVFAGVSASGWGNLIIIRHRFGLRTFYAHLSSFGVRTGQYVGAGARIGRVGSTGFSTGPHLHFELLLRGANVDPASAL